MRSLGDFLEQSAVLGRLWTHLNVNILEFSSAFYRLGGGGRPWLYGMDLWTDVGQF